jgi:methyl-accepting chemotaxis protein
MLARPGGMKNGNGSKDESTVLSEELIRKRDDAKRMAQEKTRSRTLARQQSIAERIASAVEEMTSSMEEAATAAEQLQHNMQNVAAAAEQASAGAEESRAALNQIVKGADVAAQRGKESLERGKKLLDMVKLTSRDIENLIQGVFAASEANEKSVVLIKELEKYSEEIGNIVGAVVRIADQTNLLALNAAIEAARAGEHGRGFAVVADEVRNLAETSEKAANDIRAVVEEIQEQVQQVVVDVERSVKKAREEVESGNVITGDLVTIAADMAAIVKGCDEINQSAVSSQAGAGEYLKGAEDIASNAQEQSSAAEEATKALSEQNKAFSEMQIATGDLAQLADAIKTSTDTQKSAEEIASSGEELSANIEEATNSARQVMTAIEQISKGAQNQAKAAEMNGDLGKKLDAMANGMAQRAQDAENRIVNLQALIAKDKENVDNFIAEIGQSATESLKSASNVKLLEERTNNINKIVDQIVNVTLQTNMLAVNGSIEAARAGEYGRGFSVVAGDIRTLANESSQNADKIKDMVRNMQKQIAIVSTDIEASGKSAAEEVQTAKKTTENLNVIEADTKAVQAGIQDIAAGAQESLAALEQANKAVVEIANAAEESSKMTNEAQSAAQQGYKRMQLIAKAIEEISSQADEMQNM